MNGKIKRGKNCAQQSNSSLAEPVGETYGLGGDDRELTDDELEVWAAGDPAAGYLSGI